MYMLILLAALQMQPPKETRKQYLPVLKAASKHYDIDWRLLDALIYQESKWDSNAISDAGALGLGQLMPDTSTDMGVIDPFDPGQNIWGIARYIRLLHNRFQNWRLTLAAYNAGPTRVGRCNCIPGIVETQHYVKNIWESWQD